MEVWKKIQGIGLSLNSQCSQAAQAAVAAERAVADEEEAIAKQQARIEAMPDGIVKQHTRRSLTVHQELLKKKCALAAQKRMEADNLMQARDMMSAEQAAATQLALKACHGREL